MTSPSRSGGSIVRVHMSWLIAGERSHPSCTKSSSLPLSALSRLPGTHFLHFVRYVCFNVRFNLPALWPSVSILPACQYYQDVRSLLRQYPAVYTYNKKSIDIPGSMMHLVRVYTSIRRHEAFSFFRIQEKTLGNLKLDIWTYSLVLTYHTA